MQKEVRVGEILFNCRDLDDDYNKQALSTPKIAGKKGVKPRTIEIALKKCGISKNLSARQLKKGEMYKDKATLERWINVKKKNASQIGKHFGQDASTILYWIRRHNISYDAKKLGYSRMNRNQKLRAKNKQKRRNDKETKRRSRLKYPGRGKNHVVRLKTKLKHSVSGVLSVKQKITPQERKLHEVLRKLHLRFQTEVPIAFFQDGNFAGAFRIDCILEKGKLNAHHAVILALDGVWHHSAHAKNVGRDKLLNTLAERAGFVIVRFWSDQIDLKDTEKTKTHVAQVLGVVAKCSPGLIRCRVKSKTIHSVMLAEGLERKASSFGSPTVKYHKISKKDRPRIFALIDSGKFIVPPYYINEVSHR
ncbi:DUF559 domain-containing protein [Patescibacteria group bacterium]|nr:MAG: DUF559 domain-containing protein [Patescibacteria group bacterium]